MSQDESCATCGVELTEANECDLCNGFCTDCCYCNEEA